MCQKVHKNGFNRVNILKTRKKIEEYKILFTHTMGTTIFNDYLIFTKKRGGILQLIDKQLAVMRGQLKWKYTVPKNLQVKGF
jgi:hypothetical protein